MMKKKIDLYLSGAIGGLFIVALFWLGYYFLSYFDYQLVFEPKYINLISSENQLDVAPEIRQQLIEDMLKNKILLSPQDYTNNVVNYYNIAFVIMSALLVIFSMVSFFHFKSSIKDALNEMLKSNEIRDSVVNYLTSEVETSNAEQINSLSETLKKRIESLEKKVALLAATDVEVQLQKKSGTKRKA